MLTYATGRGLYTQGGGADRPQIDLLAKTLNAQGATF
jgi:hypothetical protein